MVYVHIKYVHKCTSKQMYVLVSYSFDVATKIGFMVHLQCQRHCAMFSITLRFALGYFCDAYGQKMNQTAPSSRDALI